MSLDPKPVRHKGRPGASAIESCPHPGSVDMRVPTGGGGTLGGSGEPFFGTWLFRIPCRASSEGDTQHGRERPEYSCGGRAGQSGRQGPPPHYRSSVMRRSTVRCWNKSSATPATRASTTYTGASKRHGVRAEEGPADGGYGVVTRRVRKLPRFSRDIDAGISSPKRCYGLRRCHWWGHHHLQGPHLVGDRCSEPGGAGLQQVETEADVSMGTNDPLLFGIDFEQVGGTRSPHGRRAPSMTSHTAKYVVTIPTTHRTPGLNVWGHCAYG